MDQQARRKMTIDVKKMDELLNKLPFPLPAAAGSHQHHQEFDQRSKKPQLVTSASNVKQQQLQEEYCECIDPLKLSVGEVIHDGTYVVVHKGSYGGHPVAVKVLTFGDEEMTMEEINQDLFQEVLVWRNLDHPNIIKMIGATKHMPKCSRKNKQSENESSCCMVVEYVKGGSLRAYLSKHQGEKLHFKTVVKLALDIAKGLSYLHSKKIVHRDVKPENLLLDKQHTVKLTDFGISVFDPSEFYLLSETIGTPGYMAPEVQSGRPYGHKCDVYGFGICLWELYCCENAFPTLRTVSIRTVSKIPEDIYKDMKPSIPASCPRTLAQLIERCWDADPNKRPEMKDVVLELEQMGKSEKCRSPAVSFFGIFPHCNAGITGY